MLLTQLHISRLLAGTYLRQFRGSFVTIGRNVRINHCRILVYPGTSLIIGDGADLVNTTIIVEKGAVSIGSFTKLGEKSRRQSIIVNDGTMTVGSRSRLSCDRIWIRFGGNVSIGDYTNINHGSEIRCDNSISIGSYNQISYDVRIWDTNTHCLLPPAERRERTRRFWPYFGYEESRPVSAPVVIGDDCWIGERSVLLKGSRIESEVTVGFGTVIAGNNIGKGCKVVNSPPLRIL